MLQISNSQWVNTVFLIRMVINLYSFWVKLKKGFYSWIPWPDTATFSQHTRLEWRASPPSVPSSDLLPQSFCLTRSTYSCKSSNTMFISHLVGRNSKKVWGIPLPPHHPQSLKPSLFQWKTEGFNSRPLKLLSGHEGHRCDPLWLLFILFNPVQCLDYYLFW